MAIFLGCLTAGFGAWVNVLAPASVGGPMLITLGASTVTGVFGHAQGAGRAALATTADHPPAR